MEEYKRTGVLSIKDLKVPSEEYLRKGVAITECVEHIPCNPCVDACPFNAISMESLTDPPNVDYDKCTGCGNCVAVCPGLAIFIVKIKDESALVTLPYEFLPIPKVGEKVVALDREGKSKGIAEVVRVRKVGKTAVITVKTDKKNAMDVRNIRVER